MRPEIEDIVWRDRFEDALAEAARVGRLVAVKPTGQGYNPVTDDW